MTTNPKSNAPRDEAAERRPFERPVLVRQDDAVAITHERHFTFS